MKEVPASEFKAKCSAFLKEVQRTRQPIWVMRDGKPLAEIRPVASPPTEARIQNGNKKS